MEQNSFIKKCTLMMGDTELYTIHSDGSVTYPIDEKIKQFWDLCREMDQTKNREKSRRKSYFKKDDHHHEHQHRKGR